MSRNRSAQPTSAVNNSLISDKDTTPQYSRPPVNSTTKNQENLYYFQDQVQAIPELPQGYINIQLGQEKAKQAQSKAQGVRQKRRRQINSHSVNPNSLMVVQATQVHETEAQRSSAMVRKNHEDLASKSNHNDSSVVIMHEPENQIIHTPPSRGSVSSFSFVREKVCSTFFANPQYTLNFSESFLVNAQKQYAHFNSYYSISSTKKEFSNEQIGFSGYLQGNFTGSEFNLYQKRGNAHQLVASVYYKTEFGCSNTYRTIEVYIKNPQINDLGHINDEPLRQLFQKQYSENKGIIKLVNKEAVWCQTMKCYTMNFRGKSNYGSIKNTILVEEGKPKSEVMLFCKRAEHEFLLEIRYPLTPFIAMGIVLSSFDFKLCCQ